MGKKLYIVELSAEERTQLLELVKRGRLAARKLTRAHVLLMADDGVVDTEISAALHVHVTTVERIRKRLVEGGVDWALEEQPRPGGVRKLDDKQAAHLIALACSKPPEGQEHWSLRLLAQDLVRLEIVDSISHETVRQTLKRGTLSPG
jgi:transposase